MSGSDNLGVASRPAPVSAMIGTMVSGVDFLRNLTDRWIGRIPDIGHGSRGDHIRIYEQAGVKGEAGRDSGSSQASIRHRRVRRATEQVRGRPQSRQRRPSAMRIREVRPLIPLHLNPHRLIRCGRPLARASVFPGTHVCLFTSEDNACNGRLVSSGGESGGRGERVAADSSQTSPVRSIAPMHRSR